MHNHSHTHHEQGHNHSDHEHSHHDHNHGHGLGHSHAPNNKKGLAIALIITSGIMFVEFFGGLITNSLALLSDSGHMLSDAVSLALSLVAMWFANRPASPRKSFGYYRFEILAALFNGLALFIIAAFIIKEAIARFFDPPTVSSGSMILIALVGLLANLLSVWALMRQSDVKDNINVRSAYLHVIGDALGSVGAILAGLLMLFFGWYIADPIISVIVSVLILKSAWGVIRTAIHILMEGTPVTIDTDLVKKTLESIDGVINVHDMHVWTITSGLDSLSCHILIDDSKDSQTILQSAIHEIEKKFKIQHTTFQIETSNIQHAECKI
ncbi:cation diffusion facilitator family transporter [Paenibacillus chondroitinus]|uniref:Cation diffusion facilitator family transporter n=1 Tax=Paenibacillus chondroitinus TaxID=59842 RepID=A0ABU6DA71_9BACL|nr:MULTISPECIES: cation diffusion facilitator family transporter [Paenibacillus]MCY9662321.1 cation diffusion facilitator family transporter [Paenibacillus anseongense]MEB4794640.1 cation diffusion facilitator family transporter [Paenibacillus chondroitinus]